MNKGQNLVCSGCGGRMFESVTEFIVVKKNTAYLVREVPCLECERCESTSFSQDTAKKLERYTSGRILALRPTIKTYVYKWGDPLEELMLAPTKMATAAEVKRIEGAKAPPIGVY